MVDELGDISQANTVVQKSEHRFNIAGKEQSKGLNAGLQWDDLRVFLAVADAGSFRAAATSLGSSVNSVRGHIEGLEHQLNCILFTRSSTGTELTIDGRSVFQVAGEINERVDLLSLVAARKSAAAEGLVRLAITEGLGTFWLIQKLPVFTSKFPKIKLDLRCEMKIPDVSRLDCDIAVQLERPRDPTLKVRKIATMHLVFFASRNYIEQHGEPADINDLENHTFVHLVAEQVPSHLLQAKAQFDPQFKFVRILTNTSSAQVMALTKDVGVGILPTYASVLSTDLVPTQTSFLLSRPIWLVYNPSAIKLNRVRAVADWIIDAFDPKTNPWFRDEFIHPNEFGEAMKAERQS